MEIMNVNQSVKLKVHPGHKKHNASKYLRFGMQLLSSTIHQLANRSKARPNDNVLFKPNTEQE